MHVHVHVPKAKSTVATGSLLTVRVLGVSQASGALA